MNDIEKNDPSFDSIKPEDVMEGPKSEITFTPETAPTFELSSITIDDDHEFPLELDIKSEIQNVLAAGIFRNLDDSVLYNKLCDLLFEKRYMKMTTQYLADFLLKF